ncbi:site-specific integrase [Microbacterium timonense]|uniref:site-specific integrase n=1 Tax=Microbacterium timonense TaxID=2086576 RepID=UPI002E109C2F
MGYSDFEVSMGSIAADQAAAGRRYRVRWRDDTTHRQVEKRGFKTKRDAELFLARTEVARSDGSYTNPAAAKATVRELGTEWLRNKRHSLKASSYSSLETSWRVYVLPRWSDTRIGDIRASQVEQWIRELSEGTAPTSRTKSSGVAGSPRSATVVYRALGVLAGILDTAVRDGRIPRNVARGAQNLPTKRSEKPRRYLTHEEVVSLAEAASTPTYRTLILVLAYCGLRWSEAIGMHVRDVNFERDRIQVNRAAVEVEGRIVVGAPKNWERRIVPFPEFLEAPLRELCDGKGPDDLVFTDPDGNHLRRAKTSVGTTSWFSAALERSGIERLTPHDLRHTAASLAISSGANVKAVQRMLGHKSAAMTLDTYADMFEDDLADVAARMNQGGLDADVTRLWSV